MDIWESILQQLLRLVMSIETFGEMRYFKIELLGMMCARIFLPLEDENK